MPKYRVEYGESFEFVGDDAGSVVSQLRARHRNPDVSEDRFRRRLAIELVEWGGGPVYFGTNEKLGESMLAHGYLVELSG